jgi:single-stranded-DNA-specific exonuclease
MRWRLAESPDSEMKERFSEMPDLVVSLLWNRGLRTRQAVDDFLSPDYVRHVHDPFLFKDMAAACELIWRTLNQGEPIVVYSDYDADGVTSAAVLISTLREVADKLGKDPALVRSYIPHREKEGYGLRSETVQQLADEGMKLLISVDCGISSATEIAVAQAAGCQAIVVDHHQVPETVPDCLILHPSAPGEEYPFKHLAAVGVSFKLASAFLSHCREQGLDLIEGHEKWLLDLVAIATVTDVVPLLGENRVLERYGLFVLNRTRRPGLRQLIEAAGLTPGRIDTNAIGFGIGPRINAASRLDHASLAFDCLMADGDSDGRRLAERLNQVNQERQRLTEQLSAAAMAEARAHPERRVHVLAGDDWPAGVVGIIAGRLANKTGRPSFVFGKEGNRFVGSGRSIPEFDVMAALERTKHCLARYGGHPQACGLTIEGEAKYRQFVAEVSEFANEILAESDLRPVIDLEAEISTEQVTWSAIEWLDKFEPFGEANRLPRFLLSDLEVVSLACIGKDSRHARLMVRGSDQRTLKTIGFGLADAAVAFPPGSRIDAAVELGVNEWNGNREIQIKLVDIRPAANQAKESATAEPAKRPATKS